MYTVEAVLNMLTRRDFADFYNEGGEFDRWITEDDNAPTEEEVKAILRKLLERASMVRI
jgi:hypothetical protein